MCICLKIKEEKCLSPPPSKKKKKFRVRASFISSTHQRSALILNTFVQSVQVRVPNTLQTVYRNTYSRCTIKVFSTRLIVYGNNDLRTSGPAGQPSSRPFPRETRVRHGLDIFFYLFNFFLLPLFVMSLPNVLLRVGPLSRSRTENGPKTRTGDNNTYFFFCFKHTLPGALTARVCIRTPSMAVGS